MVAYFLFGASSLMRGWVCDLELLLDLANKNYRPSLLPEYFIRQTT
jgi:hypothetical protein